MILVLLKQSANIAYEHQLYSSTLFELIFSPKMNYTSSLSASLHIYLFLPLSLTAVGEKDLSGTLKCD